MIDIDTLIYPNALFDGHYKLIRPLSVEGGTADVWLAIDVNTIDEKDDDASYSKNNVDSGMLLAIKIYRPKNGLDVDGEQRFRDEFKIVYECRHANLLQPTNFSIYQGIPYLVLPYCKYGSSEQLMRRDLSSDDIWKFILDVSSGLNRLHTNNPPIIHQDIKPANILIDNSKDYAITDFGISSKRDRGHNYSYDEENSGTMAYMAPERFDDAVAPMAQSDIWAFGATLYEILTGTVPYGEEGGLAQRENNYEIPSINYVPADIQRLIHDCLSINPEKRPSAKAIMMAANVKQYPIRSKNWIYISLFALVSIVILFVIMFRKSQTPIVFTVEEVYENSLSYMNSDSRDSLERGLFVMDSLSNMKYIPAIYQLAYTYGWYIEEESLHRKRILGIDVFEDAKDGLYLPKIDRYSNEAMALFSKILEINDSVYAWANAQAAYRLACYYVNPNQIIKPNFHKGRNYLELSRQWAMVTNDSILLNRIDKSLETFDDN